MFNFLENTTVDDLLGLDGYSCATSDFFPILEATKFVIRIIQIAVPFGLIIWGSLDWFKALIAHDEKEMRMKRKPFLARVIAAMIVLVLPWIMTLVSKVVAGESNTADFWTCYHEAKPRIDFSELQRKAQESGNNGIIGGFGDGTSNFVAPSGRTEYATCETLSATECSNGRTATHNCYWTTSGKTIRNSCQNLTQNQCNSSATSSNQCVWTGNQYGCQNGAPHSCQSEEREIYKTSCSDFTTKNTCDVGITATHYCKWTGNQYGCQPYAER